eukprot:c14165_g2_i1 orf=436-714(+)
MPHRKNPEKQWLATCVYVVYVEYTLDVSNSLYLPFPRFNSTLPFPSWKLILQLSFKSFWSCLKWVPGQSIREQDVVLVVIFLTLFNNVYYSI